MEIPTISWGLWKLGSEKSKSVDCKKVKPVSDCRKIQVSEGYVLNAQVPKYCTTDLPTNGKYLFRKCKQQASICGKQSIETSEPILVSTESNVIYHAAIIKLNGIKCRALLDTDSGSSYASEALIDLLKTSLVGKRYKTLTIYSTKNLKIYSAKIYDLKNEFTSFSTELNKFERELLLTLLNPKYNEKNK